MKQTALQLVRMAMSDERCVGTNVCAMYIRHTKLRSLLGCSLAVERLDNPGRMNVLHIHAFWVNGAAALTHLSRSVYNIPNHNYVDSLNACSSPDTVEFLQVLWRFSHDMAPPLTSVS
jgi:hypothetical protein